uniref:cellulase n=1 Tax=Bursaphelenchus xylophilus TaxID=6326 RepID=A0A1I7SBZ3_BURXY
MKSVIFFGLLVALVCVVVGQKAGTTTGYWDCCKPSCAWPGKTNLKTRPSLACDKFDRPLNDSNAWSACGKHGVAYMCSHEQPWAVNDQLSYGFAAVKLAGMSEDGWCCSCYELTFTEGPVKGKKFVVQATNTGGDLGENHFDMAIPGCGVGYLNGCTAQHHAPKDGWGKRYGGISAVSECSQLPQELQPGCHWRWSWYLGAQIPKVTFKRVKCPKEITEKSQCIRADEDSFVE